MVFQIVGEQSTKLKTMFAGLPDAGHAAVYFHYTRRKVNGSLATVDAVDIIDLNARFDPIIVT